jgi:glycosyltransferase involved in cell wall biosynthesis
MQQHDEVLAPMVLHVRVVTGHGGGPEKTILNSPRFLGPLGYQSKLVYLHPPGDPGIDTLVARGKRLDAEVISIPDKGPLDLSVVWRLIRLCRQQRVAIWHGHDYKSNLLGLLIRPFWRMKLVTTLHGWTNLTGRMPLYVKIDKWCLKYYRAAICVSDDLYDECQKAGLQRQRCYRVYNAIDTEDYRRQMSISEAKQQLQAPQEGSLIGAVGRLSPEKGFDLLIRAAVALRQKGHCVHLWIAGDGSAHDDLNRLIDELGCGAFVRLLGHVSDPKIFYQAMDVFALSSIREGLPNVVLEAMALETPVVATRVAGVPTLIEDGKNGFIVEPNSIQSLVTGMERLIVDPALADLFRREGRARVESEFSFSLRMERVVSIYDEVLERAQ